MNGDRRVSSLRLLLFGEAVAFVMAAFVHAGMWIAGYQHREARIAESALAGALYVGLVVGWLRPLWTRKAGLVAQALRWSGLLSEY